jgi:hypothetical protein
LAVLLWLQHPPKASQTEKFAARGLLVGAVGGVIVGYSAAEAIRVNGQLTFLKRRVNASRVIDLTAQIPPSKLIAF